MQALPKILLVDDDASIRALVRAVLEESYEVSEAANGVLALVQAWDVRPDVIVLDLDMPAMGGAEAAPYLRVLSPGSRIVAFSARLCDRPPWADAFVEKSDVLGLADLIAGSTTTTNVSRSVLSGSALLRSAS